MRNICAPFFLCIAVAVSGCATIVGDENQLITISSSPDDANFVVKDDKGLAVNKGVTPTSITLHKSDGSYFGGTDYSVEFSKPGYESTAAAISSGANAWYLVGNLGFGGIIGWFIVDPLTGSMYDLSPDALNVVLQRSDGVGEAESAGTYDSQYSKGGAVNAPLRLPVFSSFDVNSRVLDYLPAGSIVRYEAMLQNGWARLAPAVASSQPAYVHFGWSVQWAGEAAVYAAPGAGNPVDSLPQGSTAIIYLVAGKPGWFKVRSPNLPNADELFVYVPSYAGAERAH